MTSGAQSGFRQLARQQLPDILKRSARYTCRMNKDDTSKDKSWRIGNDGLLYRRRRKVFPNGDIYDCEFVDNLPHGSGSLITAKGRKYEGGFSKGLFHGEGKIVWDVEVDGTTVTIQKFEGRFQNGKKNGLGILYENGDRLEGTFVDDVLHGKGSVWLENGTRQKGTWRNGKLHGDDAFILFENGDTYEGPVHFGKVHGDVGHYSYAGSKGFYTGQHKLGKKEGIGTWRFYDGSIFRGDIKNGKMSGHGIMNYENDLEKKHRYSGGFKDGLYNGAGELIFKDSFEVEWYKGSFFEGRFHGNGKVQYRDGGYYEGEFSAVACSEDISLDGHFSMFGKREGKGKRVWAAGNTFNGEWKNNKMFEGRYCNESQQSTYIGTFKNDKKSGSGREIWRSPNGTTYKDPCFGWTHEAGGVCKYIGHYRNGHFHGEGKFQAPDGREYDGEWDKGKPHGSGRMIMLKKYEKGDSSRMNIGKYGSLYRPEVYVGLWEQGRKHGVGNLTFLDGSTKKVTYQRGLMIQG